jgi:transcriptional regulator NrdR family protein
MLQGGSGTAMKTRLSVIKSDGSMEEYMHTKVLHTIDRALASTGEPDSVVAERLAEVITYFLYGERACSVVPSSEILAAIKIVLAATGYDNAAEVLSEHHFQRRLQRNRVEVFRTNGSEPSGPEQLLELQTNAERAVWCKSIIVDDLVNKQDFDRQSARVVAAMVEEKILAMQLSKVSSSLVKQLVLNDTAAVLHAQKQLQTA